MSSQVLLILLVQGQYHVESMVYLEGSPGNPHSLCVCETQTKVSKAHTEQKSLKR